MLNAYQNLRPRDSFHHYLPTIYDVEAGMQSACFGNGVSNFYTVEVVDALVGYA